MYRKALLFSDHSTAAEILKAETPRKQKDLGRGVEGFEEGLWCSEREGIVVDGNWWKFGGDGKGEAEGVPMSQDIARIRALLLSTGDRELVEASARDRLWGIGFSEASAPSVARVMWGQNLLGKCLMNVRERMKAEWGGADGRPWSKEDEWGRQVGGESVQDVRVRLEAQRARIEEGKGKEKSVE